MTSMQSRIKRSRFDILPEKQQDACDNSCFSSVAVKSKEFEPLDIISGNTHENINPIEPKDLGTLSFQVNGAPESTAALKVKEWLKKMENPSSNNVSINSSLQSASIISSNSQNLTSFKYMSVVDEAHNERIRRALEKNLAYIARKDAAPKTQSGIGKVINDSIISGPECNVQGFDLPLNNKSGVGMVSSNSSRPVAQTTSIYVSGLPPDITEEELNILFGVSGKVPVKKIRIYKKPSGELKGDALITFNRADDAQNACLQFHSLDIGDGFVINVTKADFSSGNVVEVQEELSMEGMILPSECQNDLYPVVLLHCPLSLPIDDLLVECCMLGDLICIAPVPGKAMIAAASFKDVESAEKCANQLNGRAVGSSGPMKTFLRPAATQSVGIKEGNDKAEIIEDADDVDSFLNSLL